MPALSSKAFTLLSSTVCDMKTAASTALFTVPIGKVLRVCHVVVRDPTASLAGGTSYTVTGFIGVFSLATLTTASTGFHVLTPTNTTLLIEQAANTSITLTVTTGSTAVANATIDLFGYLTSPWPTIHIRSGIAISTIWMSGCYTSRTPTPGSRSVR